jgi:hypothetical protein
MTPAEIAARLRQNALEFRFDGMAAEETAGSPVPFGLVSEFRQGEAVVTMAAFQTGDVSLYFSTGGGILGGIGRPELAALAKESVAALAPMVSQLTRDDASEPPGPGEICFYVLTPGGRFTARAMTSDMVKRDGPIVQLVRLSGALLTKVREAEQRPA